MTECVLEHSGSVTPEFCGPSPLFHPHNSKQIKCKLYILRITWAPEEDKLKVVFETPGVENILSNYRK